MSSPNTPSASYTRRPSMPEEYKQHLNQYMKEYRQQHKDTITDAQKRYREAHKNDEHLRKKRCEYSKKYYCKIKDTQPPKTDEQKVKEKKYHKNVLTTIKKQKKNRHLKAEMHKHRYQPYFSFP